MLIYNGSAWKCLVRYMLVNFEKKGKSNEKKIFFTKDADKYHASTAPMLSNRVNVI